MRTLIGKFLLAVIVYCFSTLGAVAQAGPPFACDGSIYQVQSGQLRIFDPITSTYQNVGPNNSSYNATGFNIIDNYAYASQGGNIIRISSDGTIENVFNIGFGSYSGDVDFSNNYWLRRSNTRYARIDLATGAFVNVDFSGPGGGPADVAYDQNGGQEYLIGFSGGGTLYRYNITTLTKENISVPGLPGGGYGATWTDSNGRLFTFNNGNGRLYEVFDYYTNTPIFQQVGIGVPSGNNDGFSCSQAPFPNLAPVAFDDEFSVTVNNPVSGNVLADNGNGADNDPDGSPVTVNPTPLSGPSNGMLTLNSDGTFTYTPDPNFFGVDVFEYEITDAAGLTATAFVRIEVIADPDFTVTKTQVGAPNPVTAAGQTINYQIVIENTGNIPLTDLQATDTLPDGSVGTLTGLIESGATTDVPGQLDINETWTYTTSYLTTQDDLDAVGNLVNQVSVTTEETGAIARNAQASTPVSRTPSFDLTKDVDIPVLSAPGTLTYTITVDNTGNQSLTNVTLIDDLTQNGDDLVLTTGQSLTGDTDGDLEIDVDETWVYTSTFAATQDQIDNGANILNTATVDTAETGPQTANDTTSIVQSASFDVTKGSDTSNLTAPGPIAYQITVTNTGNTSVTGLVPTDILSQGLTTVNLTADLALSGDTDNDAELDLSEVWIYSVTYQATQDNIDAGADDIVNDISIVSSNAGTETGQTVTSVAPMAALTIEKSVDQLTLTGPGTLRYEIVVTNTGNVTLTNVDLTDVLTQGGPLVLTTPATLSGDTDSDSEIDVGEVWVYTATFDALQAQIDDGANIVNEATVDTAQTNPLTATVSTSITQTDAISLAKTIAAGQPSSYSMVGDTVTFEYTVTNAGNTTLIGPITVDDDQIGTGLACAAGNILPGDSVICQHTWTADQIDLNNGSTTNAATAEDSTGLTTAVQQQTVTAVQTPSLDLIKRLVDDPPLRPLPPVFEAGRVLFYEYDVTNNGNVTLTGSVNIDDNLATDEFCPTLAPGGLLPGASIICTASYTLVDDDIDLGSTTNSATAQGNFDGTPVTSPTATAVFPVGALPVLRLDKSAPTGLTIDEVGDTITYSYTIENVAPATGIGASLPDVIFINDNKFTDPIECYNPATDGGAFPIDTPFTCEAIYTVTQDDLDAGEVVNEATANTQFAITSPTPLDLVSNVDTETVPTVASPALTVDKTVTGGPNPAAVGQTVSYQIVATNTGNQTLNTVAIADPLLGALTCDLAAPVTLAPTEALTCTGDYEIQQSDIDAQTVGDAATAIFTNTATAVANDPAGDAITPADGSVDHPVATAAPSVTITKELFPDPAADPAYSAVDDVIRFRMVVTNDGNMTLSSVDLTDSLVAGTCTVGPLAPGASDTSCIFDYTIVQGDLDRGFVENTGAASAQPIDPAASPVSADDTLQSPGPAFAGGLEVVKAGSLDLGADNIATVGDLINYTITVQNVGNVTLNDIAVTDPGADSITYAPANDGDNDNDIDSLSPNATATVAATHALTQDDINNGAFSNTATATGLDPAGTQVSDQSDSADPGAGPGGDDPTVTPIPRDTGLTVDKSFTAVAGTDAGDTITYSYLVRNTGNVTLTNIALTDDHTSAAETTALTISNGGTIASLAPGATATLTATYVITQADIDAGDPLTNIVSAVGDGPSGTTAATDTDTESVAVTAPDPAVELVKTVRNQTGNDPGDTIVFEVEVANTGNVTLSNIVLTDSLTRTDNTVITPAPSPVFESGDGGLANQIDVGETWVYTVTYVLTQADIDAGGIRNSVTGEARAPDGTPVSDVSDNGAGDGNDPTVVAIAPMPSIETVKTITSSTIEVGQTVTFAITVQNTGNVTLSDAEILSDTLTRADGTPLTINGPAFAGTDMGSAEGTLQVGETATYTASYVLVQDDIDAGGIENTATALAMPPVGSSVQDLSDDTGAGSDPTILTIPAEPIIGFEKRLVAGGPTFDAVGDVLSYEFEITNLGNVTLSAPYDVADPLITDAGGAITCPSNDLAPNASLTCAGSYSVTQDDLDTGSVDNTATATVGDAPPVNDSITVPAQQEPALELLKTPENVEPEDFIVGAVVTYTFETTNIGNVTITDPITINDSLIPASDINCDPFPASGVAPGATYTCTGDYTVTVDDVQIASVTNLATATDGNVTSPISSATIPNEGVPALTIDKALVTVRQPDGTDTGGTTFDEVGDQLDYSFTVTNSGQVSFANEIEVIDTFFADPISCYVPDASNPDLIPGESIDCSATYVITQDDLDGGEVENEAFARTEFGTIPTVVQSAPDTQITLVDADPMVSIIKDADRIAYTAVDETVTFDFTVTNTGNQTLTNVAVTDPLLPGLVCETPTLAVGDELTCSTTYQIRQEDIDRGSLTNTATASGIDPTGAAIPEVDDAVTLDGPMVAPTIDLAKIANPDPFGGVGSAITYTFEVTNTSIYTLSNITITDPLPGEFTPFTCDISSMSPGAVDRSCQVVITVTQDMVDDGELDNTASVVASDPFGNTATATDTITTDGPAENPSLEATKLVDVPATTLGTTITYTVLVANTGNVTINAVSLTDQMVRNDGTTLSLDAPFVLVSGDDDFNGRLAPTETFVFEAPYTITQDDINFGGFTNVVTAQGQSPSGTGVSDMADDGDDGDGNTIDDPTVVEITMDPVLNVTKVFDLPDPVEDVDPVTGDIILVTESPGESPGDEIVFEIRAANTGNVDIFNASPTDTLTRADGTDLSAEIIGPTRTTNPSDNGDTTLDPGEIWTWSVRYVLTQADVDAGGLENSASVTGADVGGVPVTDVSDNGNDSDGNITDDPTVLSIAPDPGLEATKTLTSLGEAEGDTAVFEILVTNTGNVTLSDFALTDTMTNFDGDVVSPVEVTLMSDDDGLLSVGETATFEVSYVLTQADVDSGGLSNTATAAGTTPSGLALSDVSDDGDDSDGNSLDDPTIANIAFQPSLVATKSAGVPDRIGTDLFELTFDMTVTNTGNVTLTDLIAEDALLSFVEPATLTNVATPVVSGFTTGNANPSYDGVADISLLTAGASLAPGETGTIALTVQYDTSGGFPEGSNTLVVSSNETPDQAVAVASVAQIAPADIFATKTATPSTVILGDTVTYSLTFLNRLNNPESNLSIIDALPSGVVYTPGTATLDGALLEPENSGRQLVWEPVAIAPDQTITITFQARVASGDVGEYVNRAYAQDSGGNRVSNVATATVTRRPEAVFDCADIIGKVFDDRNQNGYQDGIEVDRAAITVQDYFSDKFERPEDPEGEPGLPGVRLSTVDGTLITTDAFGRFSVPCAELPADIGSNFQLKLDTRTLPTGYHVTTENPRNVRVTPGRLTRLNFGAALSHLVEIDLTAAAFDGANPNAALAAWLPTLIAEMEKQPSILRLTYYRGGETARAANARLDALETEIRALWSSRARDRLIVERLMHRVQ
ncbi:MAG: Ig-like domain-containing protein [Pseudomonadota bacterium]